MANLCRGRCQQAGPNHVPGRYRGKGSWPAVAILHDNTTPMPLDLIQRTPRAILRWPMDRLTSLLAPAERADVIIRLQRLPCRFELHSL